MVDSKQEEEAEEVRVRLDTKHEENVDALVIHLDANSGDTVADNNDQSQPQLTESEQNGITPSRFMHDEPENVIDSTHGDVVLDDAPTTSPRDDTPPAKLC